MDGRRCWWAPISVTYSVVASLNKLSALIAERYSTLCKVNVDLSKMGKALGPYKGADGRIFYKANFDIVLLFGLTELKAQVCWKEKVSWGFRSSGLLALLTDLACRAWRRGVRPRSCMSRRMSSLRRVAEVFVVFPSVCIAAAMPSHSPPPCIQYLSCIYPTLTSDRTHCNVSATHTGTTSTYQLYNLIIQAIEHHPSLTPFRLKCQCRKVDFD